MKKHSRCLIWGYCAVGIMNREDVTLKWEGFLFDTLIEQQGAHALEFNVHSPSARSLSIVYNVHQQLQEAEPCGTQRGRPTTAQCSMDTVRANSHEKLLSDFIPWKTWSLVEFWQPLKALCQYLWASSSLHKMVKRVVTTSPSHCCLLCTAVRQLFISPKYWYMMNNT